MAQTQLQMTFDHKDVCVCVDFEESCYGASGRRMGHPGALSRQT